MGIRTELSKAGRRIVEELQQATGNPQARSVDRLSSTANRRNLVTSKNKVDKHFPDKEKMETYWEIYKEIPIIRYPIRSFASEVIAPGYYVDADNEEMKEELEEWLSHSCIVDGEIDKDFSILLKKAQIHREVKGTALSEKVRDEDNNLYGFKLIRPETVRAFTKPGQTVLLPPDYDFEGLEEETNGRMREMLKQKDFYKKQNGDVAAYVQIDDSIAGLGNGYFIPFSRDDIIKLTRDSDIGDIFGNSRLLAVEDRLNSMLKKLDDVDKSIESLAYPFQLFKFGNSEEPWEPSEIEAFMNQHKQSDFEPGMKQGVQGDVDIQTVSSEVPDIDNFLEFDLNYIMAEMPLPKYALGGFESEVNQFVSRSQSARIERQIEEAREEIENEWTPVLEEKAEELGYNVEDLNGLVIGEDPEELNLVEEKKGEEESEIPEDDMNEEDDGSGPANENTTRPPASTEDRDGGGDVVDE